MLSGIVIVLIGTITLLFFFKRRESSSELSIRYPFNNALFPPEFPAPSFEWYSKKKDSSPWEVSIVTGNKKYSIHISTNLSKWSPDESKWDSLKLLSDFGKIYFTVRSSGNSGPEKKIGFSFSHDSVGAPILYRQMPIPFLLAERELDSMNFMLINIGSKTSRILP